MANKYVDKSATYNGDGTSSSQAASNGAAGAWNSLANVFSGTPTYGSLSAGDTVYIRTKASGSNLTEAYSAGNLTTKSGALDSRITYIFDAGVVWPGDSGVFTLEMGSASTGRMIAFGTHTTVLGTNKNGVFKSMYTAASNHQGWVAGYCNEIVDVVFESPYTINVSGTQFGCSAGLVCTKVLFLFGSTRASMLPCSIPSYSVIRFNDCWFDFSRVANPTSTCVFVSGAYGCGVILTGGGIIGSSEQSYLVSDITKVWFVRGVGFDIGSMNVAPVDTTIMTSRLDGAMFEWLEIPGGNHDFVLVTAYGRSEWRAAGNYPVCNAILPDTAATPWSYKMHATYARFDYTYVMPTLVKRYEAAAATKTITVNLLINNRWAAPTKDRIWVDVSYVDNATGKSVLETTKATGGLATNAGAWDTTVYGAESYTEYKLELTTSGSIKQNGIITVTPRTNRTASAASDFFFIDPEIVLS